MHPRAFADITEFIFMHDEPQFSDIIFIPGTSQSAIIEKAAELIDTGAAYKKMEEYVKVSNE